MPDRMPENISDKISKNISDKISKNMSNKISEDLPIIKHINIMMEIIRNKIII